MRADGGMLSLRSTGTKESVSTYPFLLYAMGDRVVRSSITAGGENLRSCSQLDIVALHDSATAMLHVRAVNYNDTQPCALSVQIHKLCWPVDCNHHCRCVKYQWQ
jgi:hypothetical protein